MKEKLVGQNKSAQRQLKGRKCNVSALNQTVRESIHLECRSFEDNEDGGKIQKLSGIMLGIIAG